MQIVLQQLGYDIKQIEEEKGKHEEIVNGMKNMKDHKKQQ